MTLKYLIDGLSGVLYGGIGKHNVDLSPAERTALLKVCADS